MSTLFDKKIAVGVTNTTASPHSTTKKMQTSEFSIVTLVQSKFLKPLDTGILSMVPGGDPVLKISLNELLIKKTRAAQQHLLVSDT